MKTIYIVSMVFVLTIIYILLSNDFVVGMNPPIKRRYESEPSYILLDKELKEDSYPKLVESSSQIVEGVQEMLIMMESRNEVN